MSKCLLLTIWQSCHIPISTEFTHVWRCCIFYWRQEHRSTYCNYIKLPIFISDQIYVTCSRWSLWLAQGHIQLHRNLLPISEEKPKSYMIITLYHKGYARLPMNVNGGCNFECHSIKMLSHQCKVKHPGCRSPKNSSKPRWPTKLEVLVLQTEIWEIGHSLCSPHLWVLHYGSLSFFSSMIRNIGKEST